MKHNLFKINRLLSRFRPYYGLIFKLFLVLAFCSLGYLLVHKITTIAKTHGISGEDIIAVTKDPQDILSSTDEMTNFLLLGVRGEGDEAPDLTDTLIVVSYNYNTKVVNLISIPRDLWVNSLKAKINTAYHYGNEKQPGGGFPLVRAAVQETLGIPIHYSAILNFHGFVEAIDLLGGLNIDVTEGFVDHKYPIAGKENAYPESSRYETVQFQAGPQTLNGETALKFVRSRHAEGPEGTDFARSRRQQQVITAFRQKLISTDFLLNQDRQNQLLSIITKNLITDIDPGLYPTLAKLALNMKDAPMKSLVLSTEKTGEEIAILENPSPKKYDNQWVLIARDGNWEALKTYVANKLKGTQ